VVVAAHVTATNPADKMIVLSTKVYSTRCSTEQIYRPPRLSL
jgi:hypothetical protein